MTADVTDNHSSIKCFDPTSMKHACDTGQAKIAQLAWPVTALFVNEADLMRVLHSFLPFVVFAELTGMPDGTAELAAVQHVNHVAVMIHHDKCG